MQKKSLKNWRKMPKFIKNLCEPAKKIPEQKLFSLNVFSEELFLIILKLWKKQKHFQQREFMN